MLSCFKQHNHLIMHSSIHTVLKIFGLCLLLHCTAVRLHAQTTTYLNPADSTVSYYVAYLPKAEIKGCLLLLSSFGESPEMAAAETNIQQLAGEKGLVTVFASLQEGRQSFYIDNRSQASIDQLIEQLQSKYKLQQLPFYMGGFSLGGSGVLRYAERAYRGKDLLRPRAIFAIDPPLDFERMYLSLEYTVRNSQSAVAKNEADYFIKRMQYEFQAVPNENNLPYQQLSPFSFSDTAQTNIKNLVTCPVLLITEPDLLWQMTERNRSLYDLNALDCSMAINALRLLGNPAAELWLTSGKGYRQRNGQRNPHSWSIMNPEQTLKWLLAY